MKFQHRYSPSCPAHFKFSGAAKLHDPANMKLIYIEYSYILFMGDVDKTHAFKDKGKLNTITKNHPIAHVIYTFVFFFEIL